MASSRCARLRRRLVKDDGLRRTRTPSIAECSLPRAHSAFACCHARRCTWGSRGARHRGRCSRADGFRHRDPASGALSPRELPRTGAEELDPSPFGMDRAPLVDFCNQHDPRAHPQDRPNPVSRVALPRRFTPSCPLARAPRGSLLREEAGAPSRDDDSHQPSFHGPGASVLSPPARLALALSSRGERVTPTRSARTPLVVEPRQRRVETPAMPGASPVRERHR